MSGVKMTQRLIVKKNKNKLTAVRAQYVETNTWSIA